MISECKLYTEIRDKLDAYIKLFVLKIMKYPEMSKVSLINLGKKALQITNGQYCVVSIAEPCRTNNNIINSSFWIHFEKKNAVYWTWNLDANCCCNAVLLIPINYGTSFFEFS